MTKLICLIGQEFEKLLVVSRHYNNPRGQTRWLCKCICGKESIVAGSDLKAGKQKSCGNCYLKEYFNRPEVRKAQSLRLKGIKRSEETKEKLSKAFKGRKLTPEWVAKMKASKKGKNTGSNNPNWKGEKRKTPLNHSIRTHYRYKIWRLTIFIRDNFTCVFCSIGREGKLEVDHIIPFAFLLRQNNIKSVEEAIECEDLWNLHNGRTLCKKCHEKTDTYCNGTIKLLKKVSQT